MFRRHAGSVILLGGWLLMLPPVEKGAAGPGGIEDSRGNVYRVLTEAPLRWVQEAAYETAREGGRAKEANTLFVDLDREVIEWPAAVCKAREAHTLPLEGEGLVIVKRALADARPWCRYLFHGRDCAPGRVRPRSTRYACLGNLRLAFQKACEAAGLVGGRKHGGLVWHCTRNTAATDLAAAGCTIEDVMKVGGWKTADVALRYDLGNLEALHTEHPRDALGNLHGVEGPLGLSRAQRRTKLSPGQPLPRAVGGSPGRQGHGRACRTTTRPLDAALCRSGDAAFSLSGLRWASGIPASRSGRATPGP